MSVIFNIPELQQRLIQLKYAAVYLTAADFLRLTVSGISMNSSVLTVLHE